MNYVTNASIIASLVFASTLGASPQASNPIERFQTIDPKTLRATESTLRITSTPDKGHKNVLELSADFAKPGAWSGLMKTFKAGSLSAKHHSAIRLFMKSVTNTEVTITAVGDYLRPDGRPSRFYLSPISGGSTIKCTEAWTEVVIPFSNFKRGGLREWRNDAPVVVPGGDPIEEWEIEKLNKILFTLNVETRGTSTVAKVLFDDLVAIEK